MDNATGKWVNNVTWVDSDRLGNPIIGIMPEVSVDVSQPGYYVHNYTSLNQIEPWVVVAKPHPDFFMMLWCGHNPALKYAGGILMSKSKNYADMPK